ncbi:retrovirus-related pol polyprotein from transposon TNT 1-94 [Tanacetum coccineum]
MNELVNDGIKLSKLKINTGFINGLPKKWLSFCQSLRNTNHVKDSELASLFGKLKYEENLIDNIYETEKNKFLIFATPLSNAFFSTSIVQDFQDSPDDEDDTRRSHEYLNDLEEEYQARGLLAKSKKFFKKGTQRFSSAKATDQTECHKCGKKGYFARHCWSKLQFLHISHPFNQNLSDKEEVSSDDNEIVKVKVLMTLAEDNDAVSKEGARNGEWVQISMRKCTGEQIISQKKRILGVNQLTEDPSSSEQKDLVFVKSSADDTKVSIHGVERPWLSEAESFILPNHDTATDYDSADESLPPLKKLDGVEPISGPKTIKSILRLRSIFKAESLKGVIINEPSSALARGLSLYKERSIQEILNMPSKDVNLVAAQLIPQLIIMILNCLEEVKHFKLIIWTNVVSNDESFPVLNTPGNLSDGSPKVVKDGMDSGFVDPKVLEGVNEQVSTIPKSFLSLVTIEAVTCKVIFSSLDSDKPTNAKVEVKIPKASILDVHSRYGFSFYGYFVGTNVTFPIVENYAKNMWRKGEQSTTLATAADSTLQELYEWNSRYREKFGFVFHICASGRTTPEILSNVIGPAMPTAELLAAAAKLTEAEAELRISELLSNVDSVNVGKQVGDDDVPFIGPPPPVIVNETASANDTERFEEVTRIMGADVDNPYDVVGVHRNMVADNLKKGKLLPTLLSLHA